MLNTDRASASASKYYPCAVPGCKRGRGLGKVGCKEHWFMVSRETRAKVWSLFRSQKGSPRHRRAVAQAVREMVEGQRKLDEGLEAAEFF